MRKLIVSEMVSIDGFFAGDNGEIDWHNVDAEFNEYATNMLNSLDMLMFGRVTYELMASYWPSADALKNDPIVADYMNKLPKVVFSKTLKKTAWNNTTLISKNIEQEVIKIKQQSGKDIAIFGSGKIVTALTKAGLIDEYRLIVNPIVLGSGMALFEGMKERVKMELLNTKKFRNGNVMLYYRPLKNQ